MKRLKHVLTVLLMTVLLLGDAITAQASQTTSYTYTVISREDGDGNFYYTRTQDAYIPERTITRMGLNAPEDMFIDKENVMYIADTGNKRILTYDIDRDEVTKDFAYAGFQTPKGICVTQDGEIYVADSKAKAVFVFDRDWELIRTIQRPDVPSFGETPFEPSKVAADESGNVYVVGEGVYSGVIQLSREGEFHGFFAVNKANLSLFQKIQSVVFTREQLARLLDRNPTTFANVALDRRGIVYTITLGSRVDPIKKHKTNGSNMFSDPVYGYRDISDVWVDDRLLIYTSSKTGYIDVYTPDGEMIFEFGSYVSNLDVAGLYTSLSTMAVDRNGHIWTIDGIKGYVQSYSPTEYARQVYRALDLYEAGFYEEALEVWSDVLALNQMSVIAHNGIGKAYMSRYDYASAMEHFEVAGNHGKYSDAFWELRNVWLQSYLGYLLIAVAVIWLAAFILRKADKKGRIRQWREKEREKIMTSKGLGDTLYAFTTARHPMDSYYDIRVGKKGTVTGASILYGILFLAFMLYMLGKGFIYQYVDVQELDISSIVVGFFAFIILFVVCNYLVTSINDGQGSLKQVYMIPAYASIPLSLALLGITAVSYVVTTNEAFFLSVAMLIGVVWSLILLYIGLQTVHNYTAGETVKSILLTFLFIFIVVVVIMIVTIMWDRVWSFLSTLGEELTQNVF
ncbi:MAG: YIP1 family protein [Lachnospiraceae bacterium]|nr:YIP1 family protein [Lachnospiraceae bacterium]